MRQQIIFLVRQIVQDDVLGSYLGLAQEDVACLGGLALVAMEDHLLNFFRLMTCEPV